MWGLWNRHNPVSYENVAVLVAGSQETLAPSAFAMYLTGT